MNAGADQTATTARVTVVQASSVFYDTPATLGACNFALYTRCSCSCYSSTYGVRFVVSPVWVFRLILRSRCSLVCLAEN
jgi:hypothetical protein